MAKATYRIRAERSGDWWALSSPDVDGFFSQCRRLDQAADVATDGIALLLDVAADSFDVHLSPDDVEHGDEGLAALLKRARNVRARAAEIEHEANELTSLSAIAMLGSGYTVRDAAEILGVSFQRISQLTANADLPEPGDDLVVTVGDTSLRVGITSTRRSAAGRMVRDTGGSGRRSVRSAATGSYSKTTAKGAPSSTARRGR